MSEPYQIPSLPTEPRDLALGQYMDAWSRLETFILLVLRELLGTDERAVRAVAAALSAKQLKDLLTTLGTMRLTDVGAKRLTTLCERFSKHNTKRNNIVHGGWALTTIINDAPGGKSLITTTWVRSYTPVQYEAAQNAGRYDLPKVGGVTAFTIPQMQTAMDHVLTLMGEFSIFYGELPSLRKPEPQPDPKQS
jgi:hypothetical protein